MYAIMCIDKADSEALRLETRAAHLDYVLAHDFVAVAGPLTSDDGATMIGTLLLLDTDNEAQARAFADNDPYAKAGLFATVEVRRFKHLLGGLADPQAEAASA